MVPTRISLQEIIPGIFALEAAGNYSLLASNDFSDLDTFEIDLEMFIGAEIQLKVDS
jgi:hypothetical protein